MYRRPTKRQQTIRQVLTYIAMTISVLVIVTGVTLLLLGYRLDTNNGQLEQGAFLQFETVPSGATITIDGQTLNAKTPAKNTVRAGTHTFVMQRDGYEPWQKTLDVKAGTLTWLNYAQLVPKERKTELVTAYDTLAGSLATADGKTMLIQKLSSVPTFDVVDLRSDDVKTSTVTIPATVYSNATTAGVTHTFTIDKWDDGGRYVLILHAYGDKKEWLAMDTRDATATKNVTNLLDLDISSIVFSGTSGNILYALSSGGIRKLDLSAGTISRSLVTNVTNFDLFETNVITFVGTDPADATKRVVGLYREGDTGAHILRSTTSDSTTPLHIVTSRYFNQDYVAIAEGPKVDILRGSYPSSAADDTTSLVSFNNFMFGTNVDRISFSPGGDYLLAQSGVQFTSLDIEHERFNNYTVTVDPSVIVAPFKWLDADHTWSDYTDLLTIREFDGANAATINQALSGQGVAQTQNGRWLYSMGKTETGYQLQRVRMILP